MIANLLQRASHSSMLCDVNITALPDLVTSRIKSHKKRRAAGSIPAHAHFQKMLRNNERGTIRDFGR